ncbi:substrate-binding periplasmic protein [Aestuariispira ectoiniformans]|uniref:substrate-binding periplasmic protein n=1 Tax=Aestuariispira ectoiniformans TaxID=2775080 RepID=UPI00223C2311|nr:transporter substrate-binding domain-containing protein [Aestuariispira ectoiniformans]
MGRLLIAGMIVGLSLLSTQARSDCGRVYSMAHSGDYVPYQYKDKDGSLVGLDVDIVQAVMVTMGCGLELREIPPKRAQRLLATGGLDLMAAASLTPQRQDFAYFSRPYRDERVVMFVSQGRYSTLKDLTLADAVDQGYRIAAGVGGWYGPEYGNLKDRALKAGVLKLNSSTAQRIRMLLAHRVDIVVADLYVGYHHAILEGKAADITELPHVLNSDPVHFMLSRKTNTADQVEAFNKALSKVLMSESYRGLIRKYIPESG